MTDFFFFGDGGDLPEALLILQTRQGCAGCQYRAGSVCCHAAGMSVPEQDTCGASMADLGDLDAERDDSSNGIGAL